MDDSMKDELLTEEIRVLSEKVSKLSEENDYLRNEIEMKDACLITLKQQTFTESKKANTDQQFSDLQNKIVLLKKDLSKFVHGEGTLDALLAEQKSSLDKEGLGYSSVRKSVFQRGNKRTTLKYSMPYEKCKDCAKIGHIYAQSNLCGIKDHISNSYSTCNIVQMWIRKADRHLYNIICLKAHIPRNKWIVDSGCSRHMTGDKSKFISIDAKDGGLVTLGDSTTVRIIATLAEDYATATIALDSKFGILDNTLCGELILSPKDHSCDSKLCGKSNCLNKDPYARLTYISEIPKKMQKSNSIKIPAFDKENYSIWKRKILLFIKAANPLYPGILENGPFIPRKEIEATTVNGEIVPAHWVPKDP
ncbi:hypothetical protein POM88_023383 [Heracleum sosnowskyi]|uniref:Retrovirus-related Pol polyprotein from transposon TNT 1-94-like beta-barrel domain-containing protein n=1 Tax=Heracleum sosnowskyi TaxID=360622 RepID=A0AAD8IJC6_9APIA|nr:hypothetical protein POM88_023383 [Heracleum sosnowskyi]